MRILINPYRYAKIGGGGGSTSPSASLSFGGSDYLSIADANWGSYDRAKFAIAGSIYIDDLSATRTVLGKYGGTTTAHEFRLEVTTGGELRFVARKADLGTPHFYSGTTLTTATWYSFLIHYDSANATSADRLKMWINGSAEIASASSMPDAAVQTTTEAMEIGARTGGGNKFSGLIYQPTFFSGSLPDPADVFDGTAGKLKGLSGLTGAHSLLDATSATNDAILATDWTNNGTVTTSSTVP